MQVASFLPCVNIVIAAIMIDVELSAMYDVTIREGDSLVRSSPEAALMCRVQYVSAALLLAKLSYCLSNFDGHIIILDFGLDDFRLSSAMKN